MNDIQFTQLCYISKQYFFVRIHIIGFPPIKFRKAIDDCDEGTRTLW